MIGHDHDEPVALRPVEPSAAELNHALALAHVQIDALRIELGYAPIGMRREYSREDLERGRSLSMATYIGPDNELVTRMES